MKTNLGKLTDGGSLQYYTKTFRWAAVTGIAFIAVTIIAYAGFHNRNYELVADPQAWGLYGDYFAGILTPIFSFITMLVIIFNLGHQNKTQSIVRQQMLDARNEFKLENQLNDIRAALAILMDRFDVIVDKPGAVKIPFSIDDNSQLYSYSLAEMVLLFLNLGVVLRRDEMEGPPNMTFAQAEEVKYSVLRLIDGLRSIGEMLLTYDDCQLKSNHEFMKIYSNGNRYKYATLVQRLGMTIDFLKHYKDISITEIQLVSLSHDMEEIVKLMNRR